MSSKKETMNQCKMEWMRDRGDSVYRLWSHYPKFFYFLFHCSWK